MLERNANGKLSLHSYSTKYDGTDILTDIYREIERWSNTTFGSWCIKHVQNIEYVIFDYSTNMDAYYGAIKFGVEIEGNLTNEQDLTYYMLYKAKE